MLVKSIFDRLLLVFVAAGPGDLTAPEGVDVTLLDVSFAKLSDNDVVSVD